MKHEPHIYRLCTLRRKEYGLVKETIAPVPAPFAMIGQVLHYAGLLWEVADVQRERKATGK